jgi:DHA2 family multidrug resistance protein
MAVVSYWFAHLNLFVSPGHLVWPRVMQQVGTALLFAPLSVAAFMYLPKELRGPASGIFAVFRNEGGSAGTSLSNAFVQRRLQFHDARLVETLNPVNPVFDEAIRTGQSFFTGVTGDPETARLMALQAVDNLRHQQAGALSYLDAFWLFGVLALGIIPLALLMRRSVAEAGAHIGME